MKALLAGLMLAFAAFAAFAVFARPAAAMPGAWVIRDADTEITLFGTVHALPKGTEWLAPGVAARLDGADTLVLEVVLPADRFALAPIIAEIGTRKGLTPLTARITPAARPDLIAAAAAAGLTLAALDRMETWLAAITLSEATLRRVGIVADAGVEPQLEARARAASKSIIGLESAEQQLRFFDGLPEADQVAMLEASVTDLANARTETDKLIALWQAGEVDAIARDFAREARASPLLAKVLITDRNRRWADWIAGVMRRPGKVFIAVGAGHLGGPDGLLALVAARGLAISRLETPSTAGSGEAGVAAPQ